MMQPDNRLFRPIMGLRFAIIAGMLLAYGTAWLLFFPALTDTAIQFRAISEVLVSDAVLSLVMYWGLSRRRKDQLVHISLIVDTVASTGLIMCTGYGHSMFQLFYVLIVLAGGLLFGQASGAFYLIVITFGNAAAVAWELVSPLGVAQTTPSIVGESPYLYTVGMAVIVELVAFQMLLVVKLTQRGNYLQSLYDNVSDGLFILDEVGQIVDVNTRAAHMTGRTRQELLGVSLESLAAQRDDQAGVVRAQFQKCLAGEQVTFEMELSRKYGGALPVEITAQGVTGLSPGQVQAFARDITGRRLMEAEIRRQNDELRRINQELQVGRDLAMNASRLKSQFLANMSHELRTPLNSIIGYTQFVLDDTERPLADDQREDLSRVLRAARLLLDQINGVLDLARIESGRESVSISRFALRDVVDGVIDHVTPMAKAKGLELRCAVAAGLPELQNDEKKLRQILLNLLANAVKFTERGSVTVECARSGVDDVRIVVRDTGIGIPAEHLDVVFNEFHQVDPSIHKQYGGTGLGLAIVKRLTELIKGTVDVASAVGGGSSFTVVVPLTLALTHNAEGTTTVVPVRSTPLAQAPQLAMDPGATSTAAATP
jgi:PAS domain S-box-containing protein